MTTCRMRERFRAGVPTRRSGRPATRPAFRSALLVTRLSTAVWSVPVQLFMLRSLPSTLLGRRHRILVGDAARCSKGWEVQRIKPRVALPLRAVEVERIAAADLAVEQDPLVERRRSIAVLQPSAPIANGCQGPLNEVVPPPRPMRNLAPTAVRGLRVDCSHISTPNAMPASS